MRRRNWRLVLVGALMIVGAAAFFIVMLDAAPRSTDPVELMKIVGQVSGLVGALGIVVSGMGMIGRRPR